MPNKQTNLSNPNSPYVAVLTVTNIRMPERVTNFLYDPDMITVEKLEQGVLEALGERGHIKPSNSKMFARAIKVIKDRTYNFYYITSTHNSIRIAISAMYVQ